MLCSAHSFFRSVALGNALGLQMRSKILLEFPFFFELMIYLNNFESCVNCVWCTLRPSRTLIDPVSRLLSWCTAVSGSPDSSSRTGSQGTWEGERCEMLNPKRAVVNPAGHANRHTHTHLRAAVATPYRQQFDLLFTLNIFYFSSCGFTFNWHLISTGYSDFCAVQ